MFFECFYANKVIVRYMKNMFKNSSQLMLQLKNAYRWKYAKNQTVHWLGERSQYLKGKKENCDVFIYELISLMGTMFTSPEHVIVLQGDKANSMYFVVTGMCMVE